MEMNSAERAESPMLPLVQAVRSYMYRVRTASDMDSVTAVDLGK